MIEVRSLSYRYPGSSMDALHEVDERFEEGGFVAVMGSNGSGKSTLALCLNRLLHATSGEVLVDGLDTNDKSSLTEIRRRVGMIFQDPNLQLTSVTVERELAFGLENLGVDRDEMHRRVEAQLKLFNLEECRRSAPSILSGGEKQRLAIASVMLLEPCYLILDEATSLLSPMWRKSLIDIIASERGKKKIGVVLITQFASEALLADRLIVLSLGRIFFDDTPREVFSHVDELLSIGVAVPIRARLERLL